MLHESSKSYALVRLIRPSYQARHKIERRSYAAAEISPYGSNVSPKTAFNPAWEFHPAFVDITPRF
jgi:hypothetical protein